MNWPFLLDNLWCCHLCNAVALFKYFSREYKRKHLNWTRLSNLLCQSFAVVLVLRACSFLVDLAVSWKHNWNVVVFQLTQDRFATLRRQRITLFVPWRVKVSSNLCQTLLYLIGQMLASDSWLIKQLQYTYKKRNALIPDFIATLNHFIRMEFHLRARVYKW